MTLAWHVDDMKMSHVDPEEVTKFINKLKEKFKDKFGIMKVKRGKTHNCLGMTLDFTEKGKAKVDMSECIKKMVEDFSIKTDKIDETPAGEHLFVVDPNCPKLDEEQKQEFCTVTAKGLFVCKRAWPVVHTAMEFLSTRVKEPDQDDWKKSCCMINHL